MVINDDGSEGIDPDTVLPFNNQGDCTAGGGKWITNTTTITVDGNDPSGGAPDGCVTLLVDGIDQGTVCGGGGGGSGNGGGSGGPANNVNCQMLLPNGQTVGDVVQQQRAALRNAMIPGTNIDNLPTINLLGTFASIARPGGPIDFKNNFKGQANPNVLASAGNFAFYAIGSGNLSTVLLDAGAGAYGVFTATFGSRSFSNLTGPMFSDSNAAAVRNAALASNGCSR